MLTPLLDLAQIVVFEDSLNFGFGVINIMLVAFFSWRAYTLRKIKSKNCISVYLSI